MKIEKVNDNQIKCTLTREDLETRHAMSIGTVISLSPLKIKIDDLQLTENNFSINPYLLEYTEEVNITTTTNGEPSHSHQIISITHPTKLKLYSKVLCYGSGYDHYSGYQYYYVLEVVS